MPRDYQHLIQKLHVATGLGYNFIEKTLDDRIKSIVDEKLKELEKRLNTKESKK